MIDKTRIDYHLRGVDIPKSHGLLAQSLRTTETYKSKRRANKNVAAERGLYSTIINIQYGYCPHKKGIFRQLNIEAFLSNYC